MVITKEGLKTWIDTASKDDLLGFISTMFSRTLPMLATEEQIKEILWSTIEEMPEIWVSLLRTPVRR